MYARDLLRDGEIVALSGESDSESVSEPLRVTVVVWVRPEKLAEMLRVGVGGGEIVALGSDGDSLSEADRDCVTEIDPEPVSDGDRVAETEGVPTEGERVVESVAEPLEDGESLGDDVRVSDLDDEVLRDDDWEPTELDWENVADNDADFARVLEVESDDEMLALEVAHCDSL